MRGGRWAVPTRPKHDLFLYGPCPPPPLPALPVHCSRSPCPPVRIRDVITTNILFCGLDIKEREIIVDAMELKTFNEVGVRGEGQASCL